jgi:hypothetical protein
MLVLMSQRIQMQLHPRMPLKPFSHNLHLFLQAP